jgi:hypothetical protein
VPYLAGRELTLNGHQVTLDKMFFFAMEEMRVKVQSSVVNARDGSRAAIRPERVKV